MPFSFPTISQYLYRGIILSDKSRYCRQCGARNSSSFPLCRGPSVLLECTAVSNTLILAIFKEYRICPSARRHASHPTDMLFIAHVEVRKLGEVTESNCARIVT